MRTKGLRRARLPVVVALVTLLGVAVFSVMTASAPAGNRGPDSRMAPDPGLKEATYGANVAFTTTLDNFQKSSFVDIKFEVEFPKTFVDGVAQPAKFKATSCPAGTYEILEDPKRFVCHWGPKLPAGQIAKVLIVWQTPLGGTSSDCVVAAISAPCMTTKGTWFIKEGSQTKPGGPDTFVTNLTGVSFLAGTDPGTKARGYGLRDDCDGDAASELSTAPGGGIQTTVCPSTMPGAQFTPGLVMHIDHGKGKYAKGNQPTSFICIPDPTVSPSSCPATPGYGREGYTPWTFADPATFTFVLTSNITKVLHDGEDVTSTCTITFDRVLKETTIECPADENGGWDFT